MSDRTSENLHEAKYRPALGFAVANETGGNPRGFVVRSGIQMPLPHLTTDSGDRAVIRCGRPSNGWTRYRPQSGRMKKNDSEARDLQVQYLR